MNNIPAKAFESPALKYRAKDSRNPTFDYPSYFNDKVPLKVRMKITVKPDYPFALCKPEGTICEHGKEYYVWVNSYGEVTAILSNGELFGLRPNEFEVIEWHENIKQ